MSLHNQLSHDKQRLTLCDLWCKLPSHTHAKTKMSLNTNLNLLPVQQESGIPFKTTKTQEALCSLDFGALHKCIEILQLKFKRLSLNLQLSGKPERNVILTYLPSNNKTTNTQHHAQSKPSFPMNQSYLMDMRNALKHLCSHFTQLIFAYGFHMKQMLH